MTYYVLSGTLSLYTTTTTVQSMFNVNVDQPVFEFSYHAKGPFTHYISPQG